MGGFILTFKILLYSIGDELFSDDYSINLVDDIVYEVDCSMINLDKRHDIDITGYASDEESDGGTEEIVDLIHHFHFFPQLMDKKAYLSNLKRYLKVLKRILNETNPERIPIFESKVYAQVQKILNNYNNYDLYLGISDDIDGMLALLSYREDGTPYFTFFKDGLQEFEAVSFFLLFFVRSSDLYVF
ncbi:hypothetical protein INT45_011190 [Circinella minor]|uniref:Translationally-controlled tumor protein homolog n=1 Tax=Circinella minor TaxID=1195481 RepID=A0A8H7S6M8_9FUNG|nr:hypothetical protein INT45_011190 [Circinella minor]